MSSTKPKATIAAIILSSQKREKKHSIVLDYPRSNVHQARYRDSDGLMQKKKKKKYIDNILGKKEEKKMLRDPLLRRKDGGEKKSEQARNGNKQNSSRWLHVIVQTESPRKGIKWIEDETSDLEAKQWRDSARYSAISEAMSNTFSITVTSRRGISVL